MPDPRQPAAEPTIAQQIEYYDRWNADNRAGDLDAIEPEIRRRGLLVCEHLRRAGLSQPRILEVGCGTGWLSSKLVELGSLSAIDLSPKAIEIARQRHVQATFIADDFFAHDFGSEPFDAIVCIETLFYVPDQPRFVAKLAELLRPGGFLGLSCINKFVYERSSDIGAPKAGQVRRWLSKGEILALLRPQFDIRSVQSVEPRGDQGILRLVNSYKVNSMLGRVVGAAHAAVQGAPGIGRGNRVRGAAALSEHGHRIRSWPCSRRGGGRGFVRPEAAQFDWRRRQRHRVRPDRRFEVRWGETLCAGSPAARNLRARKRRQTSRATRPIRRSAR